MIVPLHTHSEYSSLDGLSTVEEVARRYEEIGAPGGALTDHGLVAGHLAFEKAMRKRDLKPIFGCELYHGLVPSMQGRERDQAHLIALAISDEGLKNLWTLTDLTSQQDHFHNVGRVFWDDIRKNKSGIIFTSACALGMVSQGVIKEDYGPLNTYLDMLGDNFVIELSTYPHKHPYKDRDLEGQNVTQGMINEAMWNIAQERGLRVVYGDDGHYAFPHQFDQHDLYLALQTGQSVFTPIEERTMYHPPGAVCIKDKATVRKALSYLPKRCVDEAIANTVDIYEQVDAKTPEIRSHLPVFIPKDCPHLEDEWQKMEPDELFMRLVVDGVYKRYGADPSEKVWDRVEYEVETLIRDNIHHYFLMGWDQVTYCDQEGISRGPGRGSSAGCIVAYVLGITDVCPLHYGLIFERFWNSGRTDGFPDIDSDFSRSLRQKIIAYLRTRYGEDKVRAIGNVGRMKPKAACDRLWKGLGIRETECEELKKIVEGTHDLEIHGTDQIGWNPDIEPGKIIYVKEDVGPEIDKWIVADRERTKLRRRYVEMCEILCSRVQQYGVHASGIAICDEPIAPIAPAYRRGGKGDDGVPATQFDMEDIDKLHIIKLDVLGLRTLDTLDEWADMVRERGVNVQWSGLDMKDHPQEMWDLLGRGYSAGIFQIEQGIPKRLCELMKPRSVEDLSLIGALIRPGPQGDGTADRYLARRRGEEKVTYIHPVFQELMERYLSVTYGLFVYQEQVINYFNQLGYDLKESDAVRKILGKKKQEQMAALHDGTGPWEGKGYLEMTWRAGLPENTAQSVWEGLERFASYSFNKSHAVCYGVIGFRTLFAKYYGPSQFYAACMRTVDGKKREKMLPMYINEARRLSLEVFPPDIVRSRAKCSVDEDNNVLFGFGDVKGVGESGPWVEYYREQLDLNSPEAFSASFEEINKAYLKRKQAATKARNRNDLPEYNALMEDLDPKSPKQKLGAGKIDALIRVGAWDGICPSSVSVAKKQEIEQELLGVILTDATAEAFETNAEEIAMCDLYANARLPWHEKVTENTDMLRYKLPGVVTMVEERRAKLTGKSFAVVIIEYGPDELEFTVWNQKWRSHKFLFKIRTPGIFVIEQRPPNDYGENYTFKSGHILKP